jgi:hypothetical protein
MVFESQTYQLAAAFSRTVFSLSLSAAAAAAAAAAAIVIALKVVRPW